MKFFKKSVAVLLTLAMVIGIFAAVGVNTSAAEAGLWVGGVAMADGDYLANGATATTTTEPSGGYAYFKDGVLTLNNYEYEGAGVTQSNGHFTWAVLISHNTIPLTLNLKGDNKLIFVPDSEEITDCYAVDSYSDIRNDSNLTVEGDGKLSTNAENLLHSDSSDITVNGGIIEGTIYALNKSIIMNGGYVTGDIYANRKVIINGGTVYGARISSYSDITINGGNILAVNSKEYDDDTRRYAILVYDKEPADSITFASSLVIKASTEPYGELVDYVAENHKDYDMIVIGDKPLVTPTITQQPEDVANATGDVTLTAKADNATRARWYVEKSDGTIEALGDAFTDGTSTQTVSKTDNAIGNRYFCAFWSVDGKIAKTDSVTVCFVPTVTSNGNVTVAAGNTAFLKVTESGCGHYADANGWYKGGVELTSGDKYYIMGTTLAVQNAATKDAGTYTYKYVTEHGDEVTANVTLTVNTGSSSTTIDTFDIFGLDNPMILGTVADTEVSVPDDANYTVESVTCTFTNGSGVVTSANGSVRIKLKAKSGYTFASGDLAGTVEGIYKTVYSVPANATEITVTVDYNNYSSWKIAYPENDTISISTDSLTLKVGTAANGQKVEGDYKCTHSGLADTNLHHTGMKYAVYSGIADNEMPAGLTLNADGTITGTPTTAGVYTVMVRADSVNANGTVSNCSGLAVKAIEIIVEDKYAHTHDTAVVSDTATCTTDGVKTLKCGCTVESPAKGHDWEAWGPVEVPTCQQGDYTQYRDCNNGCGEKDSRIIKAMHMPTGDWTTDATDHWKVCTYGCGTILVDKVAHTDADSNKKCDVCGYDMTPAQSTTEYDITVTSGTASANKAVAGTVITLTAEQIDGKVFSHWEVNGATVSDANAKETTFTMGNADVTAEAIYDDCDCKCHKGGIVGFFYKIVLFFQKLFGNNLVCNCGKKH